jgi:multiple antibiotic resistance protein
LPRGRVRSSVAIIEGEIIAMTVFSAAMLLFLVMDPFGNIPLFMAALSHVDRRRHARIIVRELLIALGVLVAFLLAGQYLLRLLQISGPALTAAGGVVLLLIAIKMVFPRPGGLAEEVASGEPFVVPLAVPYVAGPSAMAAVLLIMNREPGRWPEWLAALGLAWFVSGVIICASGPLVRLLGEKVLIAIERLMGMLLVAVAVQMLMTGVARFLGSTG